MECIGKKRGVIGNRDLGSQMQVTNGYWFSYLGYNELLTGKADPNIDSNKAIESPNITILEWLNKQLEYQGKVAAFGSWDVFPAIINRTRSGVPINAGFESTDLYAGVSIDAPASGIAELRFTVNNMFDESYLGGIAGQSAWIGAPRTAVFNATLRF
jgi:hypothetical protein